MNASPMLADLPQCHLNDGGADLHDADEPVRLLPVLSPEDLPPEAACRARARRRFRASTRPGAPPEPPSSRARHMRGYNDAQARQIFRDLIDMTADVTISAADVAVRFHRRAHLPIVSASGILSQTVNVPWWLNKTLRFLN